MKKLLLVLLSLLILVGCTSSKQAIKTDKDYSIPEYYHYESDEFIEDCDKLASYIEKENYDKAISLYDSLYDELLKIYDLSNICYVDYCEDINNQYYIDEQQYIENIFDDLSNKFLTLCHKMTEASFSDDFKKYINDDVKYNDYVDYIEKSDEEIELLAEETKLQQQYNQLNDSIESYTYTYNGKEYTYEELFDVSEEDYDLYTKLIEGISADINRDMGEVYLKLVKVRDRIAKLNGYDNYALYADTEIYGRDYSVGDLTNFKEVTKEYASEIIYLLYNYYDYKDINITGKKLLDDVMDVVRDISPLADNAYKVLTTNNIYSIDYGPGRYDGSFETAFAHSDASFIFLNLSNSTRDYFTLAHEFGHFTNAIVMKNPYPLTRDGCYDVFEIHSTGLEALFGQKASSILKDDYDLAVMSNLLEMLSGIIDACVYDDFQRYVYENPNLTLDQINSKFKDIMYEYGWADYGGYPAMKYEWMYIPHNFDSPMYYISYGTSFYATLQIWAEAKNDYDKAVKIWENIVSSNAFVDGYMKIVSDSGLIPFTNKNSVINTYQNVIDYVYLHTNAEA